MIRSRGLCALPLALMVSSCYSAPSVSDPPVLEAIEIELGKADYPGGGVLAGDELAPGIDGDYVFFVSLKGRPGRFDNGDSEAEQWIFRTVEATITVDGSPVKLDGGALGSRASWAVNDDVASTGSSVNLPSTDAGKTLAIRGRVFDALGRPSNELSRTIRIVPAPATP